MLKRILSLGLVVTALIHCTQDSTNSAGKHSAAASTASSTGSLGLNDLSVLFPIDTLPDILPRLSKNSDLPNPAQFAPDQPFLPLDGQPFIPVALLAALDAQMVTDVGLRKDDGNAIGTNGAEQLVRDDKSFFQSVDTKLQAVSVRFDPCSNMLAAGGDDSKCQPQMRVLWQTFSNNDLNIHAIYNLQREEFRQIVQTLLSLQQGAGGDANYLKLSLNEHPLIVKQGIEGSYFQGVIGLIHRYARASRLSILAGLGEDEPDEGLTSWVLTAITVSNGAPTNQSLIAVTPDKPTDQARYVQRILGADTDLQASNPAGNSPDALPPAKSPVNAENPRLHDVNNLDCASCHTAQAEHSDGNGNFQVLPGGYTSARWDLTNNSKDNDQQSLQMFSKGRGGAVRIAQRVINETADVADYVNKVYLSGASN